MTGKERAALRAQANGLEPLFQIGKGGITPAVTAQAEECFNTKELIKLKVLAESSPVDARTAAQTIAAATGAEIIQVIGGCFVLFRINEKLRAEQAAKKKRLREQKKERTKRAAAKSAAVKYTTAKPADKSRAPAKPADKSRAPSAAGGARRKASGTGFKGKTGR